MEFKEKNKKSNKEKVIKKLPSVSIIMPVYNAERTLVRSIESVLRQNYSNFELIIVNDGSNDDTIQILRKYATNNKIKIINQENQGVSIARNIGLMNANSDLIAFIDSDDYILPDFLRNLVRGMLESNVDLCVTGIIYKENNVDSKKSTYLQSQDTNEEFIPKIFDSNGPKGFLWNKIWNKKIIDKYHLKFDSEINIAEDLLFSVQYLFHTNEVKILSTHDYVHVYDPNSLSAGMDIDNENTNYIQIFNQYMRSLKIIIKLLSRFSPTTTVYPEVELTNACITLLQKIYFTDENYKYGDLIPCIRSTAKYYHHSLFKNDRVTFVNRVKYVLTIYAPYIMKSINYIKYNIVTERKK